MRPFRIKLKRIGRWKKPVYAVVVTLHGISPKSSKYFERLGFYAPASSPKFFFINFSRVSYWLMRGASLTDTVGALVSKLMIKRKSRKFLGV